jgi:hypothetical protein
MIQRRPVSAARKKEPMPRYLISFDDGSMDHIPEEDWPAVGEASHAVVRKAKAAGVWIFGGGVQRQQSSIVATDGTITDGPVPETKSVVGGFSVIECLRGRRRSRGQPESPKGVGAPKRSARSCSTRSPERVVRPLRKKRRRDQRRGYGALRGVRSPVESPSSGIGLLQTKCGWCVMTDIASGKISRIYRLCGA